MLFPQPQRATTAGTIPATVTGAGVAGGSSETSSRAPTTSSAATSTAPTTEPSAEPPARDEDDVFGAFDDADEGPTTTTTEEGPTTTPRQWAPAPPVPGSVEPTTRPDLGDMTTSHTWRGQAQPPVGVRARQLLNWARDEDADRRRDFARERREAGDWLHAQLRRGDVGDATRRLLLDARAALAAHDAFDAYHRRTFAATDPQDPAAAPRYRPRLDYRADRPLQLGAWTPPGSTRSAVRNRPGRDQHRPYTAVNTLWRTEAENNNALRPPFAPRLADARPRHLLALAHAEDELWARPRGGGAAPIGAENLAWRETTTFEACIDADGVGLEGWTHRVPGGGRQLWDGYEPQGGAGSFAAERGARRAGLQAGLRQFASAENFGAAVAGARLVLPDEEVDGDDEALDEEALRRRAGIGHGRPLAIPSLPANQMRATEGKMDPQGFTANMAQFWRIVRDRMQDAREAHLWEHGPARRSAGAVLPLPPDSLFGPYVWRGVSPATQVQQDVFREMRGLKRLFDREQIIAPRPLLEEMEEWYQRGYSQDENPGLLECRDVDPSSGSVRGLDTVELEWLRFLLNQSMTADMVHDLQPRTTLFITFAERLNRIFTDPSDTLFPERDTSVTIEELIAHMDKVKAGPAHRVTFYPYDVKLWLERLDAQGRCRYAEDFRSYGRVQRPVLAYHPESLILWRQRADAELDLDAYPEDAVYAPRFDDCRTWLEVVAQPSQQQQQAPDDNVAHYFHCLAYRWGHAMRAGEAADAGPWRTQPGLDFKRMQAALDDLESRFRAAIGWDANAGAATTTSTTTRTPMGEVENTPLVEVLQRTLNRPWVGADAAGVPVVERVRTDEALRRIRAGIVDECVRCDSMLFRGRATDYRDPAARRTRESVWDWARPAVRGPVKRFFGLDRWPPRKRRSSAAGGADVADVDVNAVDPEQVWDAYTEDPTPWTYWRPKLRPYGEERTRFREGHMTFPIGDTARQKEVVKNRIRMMVGRCKSLVPPPPPLTCSISPSTRNFLC